MRSWYPNQSLSRCVDVPSIPSLLKCWQADRAFSTHFNDFPLWRWVKRRRGEQIAGSQVIFLSWRLVRELPQMFLHHISAAVLSLFCHVRHFSRSRFYAFLLFWPVFSVHLPRLPPPSPPTTFYVSVLNVFKQSDTTTGSERGAPLTNTCTNGIISNAATCTLLPSALALQGQGFFQEELASFSDSYSPSLQSVLVSSAHTPTELINCSCTEEEMKPRVEPKLRVGIRLPQSYY